jgi:hypothetical protein
MNMKNVNQIYYIFSVHSPMVTANENMNKHLSALQYLSGLGLSVNSGFGKLGGELDKFILAEGSHMTQKLIEQLAEGRPFFKVYGDNVIELFHSKEGMGEVLGDLRIVEKTKEGSDFFHFNDKNFEIQ